MGKTVLWGATLRLAAKKSARRTTQPFVFAFGLLFFLLTTAGTSHAYPWMIRHGYTTCSTCHADPSGGELLTQYGRATSNLLLSMQYGEAKPDENPKTGVFWGALDLPDSLLISGAYRSLSVLQPAVTTESSSGTTTSAEFSFIPVMQADLYGQWTLGRFKMGGSLGLGRARPGAVVGRAAQITTNEDGMNLISRVHYLGFDIGDEYTLRIGRLNQPFGIRIPEHTSWVRQATRTDRESAQQHGVALAYVGEKLRAEVLGIAGNYQLGPDDFRERGYSAFVEATASTRLAVGVSSRVTFARMDRINFETDTLRQAHGLMARWAPLPSLAFLFETDALFRTNADAGYVGFLQMDYEFVQGLHAFLTGEFLDEGLAVNATSQPVPGSGEPRFGGWLSIDYFFYKQLEVRVDAIARQDEPFTLLSQLHFYL